MLNTFIEGLQDGLNDEHRTAFRTMFVLKRDVATAIALAQFYEKTKEFIAAHNATEALPSEYVDMIGKELRALEAKLCASNATSAG